MALPVRDVLDKGLSRLEGTSPSAKRVRFNDSVAALPAAEKETKEHTEEPAWEMTLPAEDVIRFRFGTHAPIPAVGGEEGDGDHGGDLHVPLFTHQILTEPKEILTFSQSCAIDLKVLIHTCTRSLSTKVHWTGHVSKQDRARLQASLDAALPPPDTPACTTLVNAWPELARFIRGADTFVMYRVTDKDEGAACLLAHSERLAMWYIETAEAVDFSDEAWEAIFCFRVSPGSGGGDGGSAYDYVGYLTLYTFVNPIQGCRIRICQALVLPSEQGCGVGRELVLAAYRLAAGRPDVSQITVGTLRRRLDTSPTSFYAPITYTVHH